MKQAAPVHPADKLALHEKCRIYYRRVVDLAVARGLLSPDPATQIGHFAFSDSYAQGKILDNQLRRAIRTFEEENPEAVAERAARRNRLFRGAVEDFIRSRPEEKIEDLIRIGASYSVWPAGTSFVLTYPWDLSGRGRPVQFRPDLTEFMKRRVIAILRQAGKLRGSTPFGAR
ncbi:MAG: hypothetical protein P8182_00895 [Deltaproteobacteria bacterium]